MGKRSSGGKYIFLLFIDFYPTVEKISKKRKQAILIFLAEEYYKGGVFESNSGKLTGRVWIK